MAFCASTQEEAQATTRSRNFWGSLPDAWRRVIIVFLTVRVLSSICAVLGNTSIPANTIAPVEGYSKPTYKKGWEMIAGVWERWDALWYIHLARDGYRPGSAGAVFFPLYPMLIRMVRMLTGLPWLFCALVVSNSSYILALYFLYRLAEKEKDEKIAYRTLWYQALFPGSLFFLAPYTESLFLALSTGAFLFARKRRWALAAFFGALASVTRNLGIAIIVPLLAEFLRQRRETPPALARRATWLLLVPVGMILWMAFWKVTSGDPLIMLRRQDHWQREFEAPWVTLWLGLHQAWEYSLIYPGGVYILEAACVVFGMILGVMAFRTLPLSYNLFIWLQLLPPLFVPFPGRVLLSCTRYVSVIFPIFMTMAIRIRQQESDTAFRMIFAGLFGLCVALYASSQWMY